MKNIYCIAYRLYTYRKDNGLTQEQMAELLNIGVRHYQNLEHGKKLNPHFSLMIKIHKVCGIDLNELADEMNKKA